MYGESHRRKPKLVFQSVTPCHQIDDAAIQKSRSVLNHLQLFHDPEPGHYGDGNEGYQRKTERASEQVAASRRSSNFRQTNDQLSKKDRNWEDRNRKPEHENLSYPAAGMFSLDKADRQGLTTVCLSYYAQKINERLDVKKIDISILIDIGFCLKAGENSIDERLDVEKIDYAVHVNVAKQDGVDGV